MAKFGNMEMQRHYDSTRGNPADRTSRHKPESEEKADFGERDEQPIEDSIDEHGPVEHIEMHTHHKDGHVHKSMHHDSHSAHEHINKAFGEQQPEPGESPEYEAQEHSSGIPTLG